MVQKFLGILSSSIPTERVFSIAGLIDAAKRSKLSTEMLMILVFLHENFHLWDKFCSRLKQILSDRYITMEELDQDANRNFFPYHSNLSTFDFTRKEPLPEEEEEILCYDRLFYFVF